MDLGATERVKPLVAAVRRLLHEAIVPAEDAWERLARAKPFWT